MSEGMANSQVHGGACRRESTRHKLVKAVPIYVLDPVMVTREIPGQSAILVGPYKPRPLQASSE